MQKKYEINLNELASIQEPSENNSTEQQERENLDNTESGSNAIVVNSNANNGLIQEEPLPEENQAVANRERKERIPWTEEEHRSFLQGLNKHGRARWKEISKEFVPGRTPTQIASHAQKYFQHQKEVAGKERKKRRGIHDITVDNNVTVASLPIEQQTEIPSIEQQNEIPRLVTPSIEQQIEIPSIEGQNKISPLVTHPVEKQNENISPHSTTLNDNNIDKLVTPHNNIEPFQEMESQPKLAYTFTVEITPHNMKNVVKVCELLEENLKS